MTGSHERLVFIIKKGARSPVRITKAVSKNYLLIVSAFSLVERPSIQTFLD